MWHVSCWTGLLYVVRYFLDCLHIVTQCTFLHVSVPWLIKLVHEASVQTIGQISLLDWSNAGGSQYPTCGVWVEHSRWSRHKPAPDHHSVVDLAVLYLVHRNCAQEHSFQYPMNFREVLEGSVESAVDAPLPSYIYNCDRVERTTTHWWLNQCLQE